MTQETSGNGKRIKDRRKQLGLTMDGLADLVGYTSATRKTIIFHLEANDTDIPLSRLPAFAKALETNVYYLLGISEKVDLKDADILEQIEVNTSSTEADDEQPHNS